MKNITKIVIATITIAISPGYAQHKDIWEYRDFQLGMEYALIEERLGSNYVQEHWDGGFLIYEYPGRKVLLHFEEMHRLKGAGKEAWLLDKIYVDYSATRNYRSIIENVTKTYGDAVWDADWRLTPEGYRCRDIHWHEPLYYLKPGSGGVKFTLEIKSKTPVGVVPDSEMVYLPRLVIIASNEWLNERLPSKESSDVFVFSLNVTAADLGKKVLTRKANGKRIEAFLKELGKGDVLEKVEPEPWLLRIKKDGKYGLIDEKGEMRIEPKFDEVQLIAIVLSDDLIPAKIGATWGFFSLSGDPLIEPKFEEVREFRDGFAAVKKEGKWGFINLTGEFVIEPKFEEVEAFSDRLAAVKKEGKWGFINLLGKFVIEPRFDDVECFRKGLAPVMLINNNYKDEYTGFIEELHAQYEKMGFEFPDGYLRQQAPADCRWWDWGVIDVEGRYVADACYRQVVVLEEGSSIIAKSWVNPNVNSKANSEWALLDREGHSLTDLRFSDWQYASDRLIKVGAIGRNGDIKYGYIDKEGKVVIPLRYDDASHFSDGIARVGYRKYIGFDSFFIDESGRVVLETVSENLEHIGYFYEGLAVVGFGYNYGIGGCELKFGYIDSEGNLAIEPKYNEAGGFWDGRAWVGIDVDGDCKYNLINENGEYLLGTMYDEIVYYCDEDQGSLVSVKAGNEYGFVNLEKGKLVTPVAFDEAFAYNRFGWLKLDGKEGWVNTSGEYIWEPSE